MPSVVSPEHYTAAGRIRELLATYAESEDLINIGAYKSGANVRVDWALEHLDSVRSFLAQKVEESSSFEDTVSQVTSLAPEANKQS
jgi:flagellum-specific ATP synthase